MSEEVDKTKTEAENGIPETSTVEENDCNGVQEAAEEKVEPSVKRGSKFGASLRLKAQNAKEEMRDKVGGLKDRFAKFRQKSEGVSTISYNILFYAYICIYILFCSITYHWNRNAP